MGQFDAHCVFHQKNQTRSIKKANVKAIILFTIITKKIVIIGIIGVIN